MIRVLLLMLIPASVFAQFSDNFSDGNFSHNPYWTGDSSEFIITQDEQLRLYSSGEDTCILSTENQSVSETEWRFWVRFSFSPSNNNFIRIYLISNDPNLKGEVNAYYIKIGENGADDSIDLYRQDGDSHTKIIDGLDAHCAISSSITVKIIRDTYGNWQLYTDINGGENFILEGETMDNTYITTNYFGVYCRFTASNAQKVYFDNFYVGDIIQDIISPILLHHYIQPPNKLNLIFSELLDSSSVYNMNHYSIDSQSPASVQYEPSNNKIILTKTDSFNSDQNYFLQISGIRDISNNLMNDTIVHLFWHELVQNDIVLNEIMADPYPSVDLPEEEYIEIYNNCSASIELINWTLTIGSSNKTIPEFVIEAGEYVIFCSTSNVPHFEEYGACIGIPSFPSLTNAGTIIALNDSSGNVITSLRYSDSWYDDSGKKDGGWSLERINPKNYCSGNANWTASKNPQGGTPGLENSVKAEFMDTSPPHLDWFYFPSDSILELRFNELIFPVDSSLIFNSNIPFVSTEISESSIWISFKNELISGIKFTAALTGIEDECGNSLDTNLELLFYRAQRYDLIINEIMADPTPAVELPEVEYIELYNRSGFDLNLINWIVDMEGNQRIIPSCIIPANDYLLLCPENNCNLFGPFVQCLDVLGNSDLSNDGKSITLYSDNIEYISSVSYSTSWYQDELKTQGGWSLERIDPENICGEGNNWTASTSETGGTPGSKNTVHFPNPDYIPPVATRLSWIDNYNLMIYFDEPINSEFLNKELIILNSNIHPDSLFPLEPEFKKLQIHFQDSISSDKISKLEIKGIYDCSGNISNPVQSLRIGKPLKANPSDLIINEILFNPVGDGADYIELYNRSEKIIDLRDLNLALWDDYSQNFHNVKGLSKDHYLLFSQDYIVLTPDPSNILYEFFYADSGAFMDPPMPIPQLSNESDDIYLLDKTFMVIDHVLYHEDMHFNLLNSFEGVALERINYNQPGNVKGNWHSAAESVGFGTPGLENSQFLETHTPDVTLSLSGEIFSPDNDGFEDVLQINYKFEQTGFICTLHIFNSAGYPIRKLLNNAFLEVEGTLTWDGLNDAGEKVNIGIYVILFEYLNTNGTIGNIKKTCVLAGKFY